jgi:hypothetical protein
MPGLGPGIHVFHSARKAWMAGTSPAMTMVNLIPGPSVPFGANGMTVD